MQKAFSLVELSIVLVILGLLTGGILAGQSLIRASELRSVGYDIARYSTAIYSFREKYRSIPGDMANATSFWAAQHATPGTCRDTPSTTAATCNGDGDGRVEIISAGSYEMLRAWQHLANAGLVEGSYTGVGGALDITKDSIPGQNVPKGKMSNSGYYILDFWNTTGAYSSSLFAYDLRSIIGFGARSPGFEPSGDILSASEAWGIDTKLDDGIPSRGRILSNVACSDAANNLDYDAVYKLTTSGNICAIMMRDI